MRLETVTGVMRPNGLALWIMEGADGTRGPQIVPNVKHVDGDYAELIDVDGHPIPHGYKSAPIDTTKWWVRCCHADGTVIWLMPFEAWRILRDGAAEAAMKGYSFHG